jgi:hypothetical protein
MGGAYMGSSIFPTTNEGILPDVSLRHNIIAWSYPPFKTGKMVCAFLYYFKMGDTYVYLFLRVPHNE